MRYVRHAHTEETPERLIGSYARHAAYHTQWHASLSQNGQGLQRGHMVSRPKRRRISTAQETYEATLWLFHRFFANRQVYRFCLPPWAA